MGVTPLRLRRLDELLRHLDRDLRLRLRLVRRRRRHHRLRLAQGLERTIVGTVNAS